MSEKRDIAHLANSDEPVITGIELEDEPYLPNPIARFRHWAKEPLGEFLGTMVLIIFGNGVNCQVVLSELTQGSYLSISFGWGIGVMMGIYACGGISGAHLNRKPHHTNWSRRVFAHHTSTSQLLLPSLLLSGVDSRGRRSPVMLLVNFSVPASDLLSSRVTTTT